MYEYRTRIRQRYGRPNLAKALMEALASRGKDLSHLTRQDLRTFEEFHLQGRTATLHLAGLVGVSPGMRVLDLGCGVGGPARTLAAQHGCFVIGLDLSEAYIQAAGALSLALDMKSHPSFVVADAQRIPHASGEFDVAWMQHAGMNIPDKPGLVREVRRVLRPGGKFAFYEVFGRPGARLAYPLPWADDAGLNFLVSERAFRRELSRASFQALHWQDVTRDLIAWGRDTFAPPNSQRPPMQELSLVIGADYELRTWNLHTALAGGDLHVIQAVLAREGA